MLPKKEIIERLEKAKHELEFILKEFDKKESETQSVIFMTERAQLVHQYMHEICRIASIAPVNEALRREETPELSRLKTIIKYYRNQIKGNNLSLHPKDY